MQTIIYNRTKELLKNYTNDGGDLVNNEDELWDMAYEDALNEFQDILNHIECYCDNCEKETDNIKENCNFGFLMFVCQECKKVNKKLVKNTWKQYKKLLNL